MCRNLPLTVESEKNVKKNVVLIEAFAPETRIAL